MSPSVAGLKSELDDELHSAIYAVRHYMEWEDFDLQYDPHVEIEDPMVEEVGWDWEAKPSVFRCDCSMTRKSGASRCSTK